MAADYSENSELIRRVQEGSRQAMDELVQSNMGLVRSIVRRFRDRGRHHHSLLLLRAGTGIGLPAEEPHQQCYKPGIPVNTF